MHAKATLYKSLRYFLAVLIAVTGVSLTSIQANAAAACNPTVISAELISDPVFYSGLTTYDANYIGYKITTGASWNSTASIAATSSFGAGRISLASHQPASQTVGVMSASTSATVFFLAKINNDTDRTAQTHTLTLSDGTTTCDVVTTLNSAGTDPAATKAAANKVDSVTVGAAPASIGQRVTLTVKGQTGTIGGNGELSFAPISYSTFAADMWKLVSTTVVLNQATGWVNQGSSVTYLNKLFMTGQQANGGLYTASYVFELIGNPTVASQLNPIQYVASGAGVKYTGTMPGTTAVLTSAGVAAPVNYTVQFEAVVNSVGTGASGTFTSKTVSVGATTGIPTDAALTGYTFGGWSEVPGDTTPVANPYLPTSDTTLYAIWTSNSGGGGSPAATEELSRKVTICHRTHSVTNPYVRITVDYNSVNKKSGHQIHDEIFQDEHVFKAGIYKRAKDKDWGDIIPADPSGLGRWKALNWTTLGAQIYNGTVAGCPSYDPIKYYNALREAGVPEKKIKQEMDALETEQSEANPGNKKTDLQNLKYTGNDKNTAEEENDKVTICHATNSVTNPYRKITVSSSSVTNKAGHYSHDDIYLTHHVFDATVNYPANKKDWGDIIPVDPTGKGRWAALNWTPLGQKIYSGAVAGCAEETTQEYYNKLREDDESKKEVKADLEEQNNTDDDPKDIDEVKYDGPNPDVEKTEPKEPVQPADKKPVDQSLSGIVWLDLNRDGIKDPDEPLMPKITLNVVQVTSIAPASAKRGSFYARGPINFNRAAITTVLTDANGYYEFPSLGAGDWKVITGVPQDLGVTYDSQGGAEGEVVTTVPVASSAFTWVGLVGDNETINEKLLEEILTTNPSALPIAEQPKWLQDKIKAIIAKRNPLPPVLAYTGSNDILLLALGSAMLVGGLLTTRLRRRRSKS